MIDSNALRVVEQPVNLERQTGIYLGRMRITVARKRRGGDYQGPVIFTFILAVLFCVVCLL